MLNYIHIKAIVGVYEIMKKKLQFVFPAIFVKLEDGTYQVVFPDLDIYTDGKTMSEAYVNAEDNICMEIDEYENIYQYYNLKDLKKHAIKYDIDFNSPSKIEALMSKCKNNETTMLIDAIVEW